MIDFIQAIYSAFQGQSETCLLAISKEDRSYRFTVSSSSNFQEMLDLFKEIFSIFPIQEICARDGITALTKVNVRRIFVQLAPDLNISSFEELNQIFLDRPPQIDHFSEDKAKSSGKGFEGLCEKVYLQGIHRLSVSSERDPVKTEIREAEFLTSRMADREYQEGSTVYLNGGSRYSVAKTVVKGGAYISVLRDSSDPSKVKVVCRGTAMRRTATGGLKSGLNDLQYEIGNGGVQSCWPEIREYFSSQNITEVEIYGKSLGGAHAQRLAILFMQQLPNCAVRALTTVCSVGVGGEAEALFKQLLESQTPEKRPKLTVIRNGGAEEKDADYIPYVGGVHLGATIDPRFLETTIYYIHPSSVEIAPPNPHIGFPKRGIRFAASFSKAHVRQSTLEDFSYHRVDDEQISSELTLGNQLESPRRFIAYKKMTSFSDFVHSRRSNDRIIGKVTMAAGMVFLGLLGGTIGCLLAHPGMVIYQNHGLLLTLPTIAMAAGSGTSLCATLLGSCIGTILSRRKSYAS